VDYLNHGHLEHQEAGTITEHRRCGQQRGQEPNPLPTDQ
jgi:hypothetical protein